MAALPRLTRLREATDMYPTHVPLLDELGIQVGTLPVDVEGFRTWWLARSGLIETPSGEEIRGYVSQGRWVADCTCGAGFAVSPSSSRGVCLDCGLSYTVKFPGTKERARAEDLLLERPDAKNRNWARHIATKEHPNGEPVSRLETENKILLGAVTPVFEIPTKPKSTPSPKAGD